MTIEAILMDIILIVFVFVACVALALNSTTKVGRFGSIIVGVLLSVFVVIGTLCYFKYAASGQRALIDQKSNLSGGLERTVTVYTANGDIIAQYTGIIDIETNDGGYVKFDFEGKRYIYYNCFVESIADIG